MELSLGFLIICEFRVCIERSGTPAKSENVLYVYLRVYAMRQIDIFRRGQAIVSERNRVGGAF